MRHWIVAAAALALVGPGRGPAQAQTSTGGMPMQCILYNAFAATSDVTNQLIKKRMMVFWVQGFLTRADVAADRELFSSRPDIERMTDSYCAEHPNDTMAMAATALEAELYKSDPSDPGRRKRQSLRRGNSLAYRRPLGSRTGNYSRLTCGSL